MHAGFFTGCKMTKNEEKKRDWIYKLKLNRYWHIENGESIA